MQQHVGDRHGRAWKRLSVNYLHVAHTIQLRAPHHRVLLGPAVESALKRRKLAVGRFNMPEKDSKAAEDPYGVRRPVLRTIQRALEANARDERGDRDTRIAADGGKVGSQAGE